MGAVLFISTFLTDYIFEKIYIMETLEFLNIEFFKVLIINLLRTLKYFSP